MHLFLQAAASCFNFAYFSILFFKKMLKYDSHC